MKPALSIAVLSFASIFVPQARGLAAPPTSVATQTNSPTEPCPPPPALIASFLNFSPAQTEQFTILLTQFQADITALQQQIAPRQQQLDVLLSQANPNVPQIGVLVVQLHALQQQVQQVIQGYHTAFVGLLSTAQHQQLQLVATASQIQPAVAAFAALQLVAPPQPPCPKP